MVLIVVILLVLFVPAVLRDRLQTDDPICAVDLKPPHAGESRTAQVEIDEQRLLAGLCAGANLRPLFRLADQISAINLRNQLQQRRRVFPDAGNGYGAIWKSSQIFQGF